MFSYTYGINQVEAIFTECIRGDIAQLLVSNGAHAATFHLYIQGQRFHIAHKHHDLQRFYIRSGCNQCAGNCNTEILVVAELAYQFVAVTCRICDFLYKSIVGTPEYLFRYLYDISSMSFIEGEYQCLRQIV